MGGDVPEASGRVIPFSVLARVVRTNVSLTELGIRRGVFMW